jgi:calcineurin-like phosphoesterase family protein
MSKIWLTSDLHLGHDREFIWGALGYADVNEMNIKQIEKFNSVVSDEDEVWILGDLVLGDIEGGLALLKQLKGKIHVCLGNHDSAKREQAYRDMGWDVQLCARFKYKKISFYLSHYPTITHNLDEKEIWQVVINLFGHTHQETNFYHDDPWMYHVGVDSHDGYPISLDKVLEDIREEMKKCQEMLDNDTEEEVANVV